MNYRLIISSEADNDIDEIVYYISRVLNNLKAAAVFLDDLEKCYYNIANNPLMYSLCNDEKLREKGYRKVVIKNYLVLYRIA